MLKVVAAEAIQQVKEIQAVLGTNIQKKIIWHLSYRFQKKKALIPSLLVN